MNARLPCTLKEGINLKNGKKPTLAQKRLMQEWGLNPADWLVVKDLPDVMLVVNRYSGKTTKEIPKGVMV